MSRSWLTFEIENTEIENAENGFFPECTYISRYNQTFLFYLYYLRPKYQITSELG